MPVPDSQGHFSLQDGDMKNLPGAGTFQANTSVNLSLSFMLPAWTKSSSLEGSTFRTKACLLSEGTWTESPTLGSFLLLAETGSLDVLGEYTAGVASEISPFSSLASLFIVDVCPLLPNIFWDG